MGKVPGQSMRVATLGISATHKFPAGIVLSIGAAVVAYISCEAAQRLKLADSAKLFALTFLLVTFGAQDGVSNLFPALPCCVTQLVRS